MAIEQTDFRATMRSVHRLTPILILLSAALNLLLLVGAIYMLQIYDRVLTSGSHDTLIWLTVIAVFAIAVYAVVERSRHIILSRAAFWLDRELTAPAIRRRMEARLAGTPSQAGPREVADLRNFYRGDAVMALYDAPWGAIFILFIWALHPVLGMIALGGAGVLFGLSLLNDLLTRKQQREAMQAVHGANDLAIRYVDAGETIRPLGMGAALFDRWQGRAAIAHGREAALQERTSSIVSISRGIRLALQVMILGAGAFLVLRGDLTAGAMIAASITLGRALSPIERLTAAWRQLQAARVARTALDAALKAGEGRTRLALHRPKGALALEGVHFAAPGSSERILKNISFAIEPGTCLAIVGPSGAGKSSLCRLLVGAWAPTAGHVRLDGADVFSWDPDELGHHIGYLPQRVDLFPGTIAENIARFGKMESDAVIAAAEAAGVHKLILRFPKGYDTVIDPSGEQISLGQRQRIGLARALYGGPSFVVLDEPNSNLDREGEECLHNAIALLKRAGASVVVVSHRASILKLADLVLALSEGQVEQFGKKGSKPQVVAETREVGAVRGPRVRISPAG
ncbi:type I secretion system permease/ATPase [Sedimentimonas flavescens]|uniref:type I secretion system permease/ATPase n=1 Tax=Sedimentimonas flavescens TaxID=2851012 RepID=UPI001C49E824|nr:type I secretion system permease/ATPase [Sedimentimonas flavescens]MBW0159148.1 type I secretion system permease/ATPase [Sedimentimonas flavescens]